MAENRNVLRDTVCADLNRIMDSCRDRDCFEDVRVFLTDYGQELISRSCDARVKSTEILSVSIVTEPLQFNKGFYQIDLKFYVRLVIEVCAGVGNPVEAEGVAVCCKKVILYGGETGTYLFRSDPDKSGFCCGDCGVKVNNNMPTVVVEALDPVCLDCDIAEVCRRGCTCSCGDIPENVCCRINGVLCDRDVGKALFVTLGFFSVVRVERAGQYLLGAAEYSVPDKECVPNEDIAPCDRFRRMPFPEREFRVEGFRPDSGCGSCGVR